MVTEVHFTLLSEIFYLGAAEDMSINDCKELQYGTVQNVIQNSLIVF